MSFEHNQAIQLYDNNHFWLFSWLRKKLGCPEDAKDISHDTFVRLLSSAELSSLNKPRAYLLVTATRLLINRSKKQKIEIEAIQQMSHLFADVDNQCPLSITASIKLLSEIMHTLQTGLSKQQYQAFMLSRVEGKSYQEIAEYMGVSTHNVKYYITTSLVFFHQRIFLTH